MIYWIIAISMQVTTIGYYAYIHLRAKTSVQKDLASLLFAPIVVAFSGILGLFIFTDTDDRLPWLMAIFTACLVFIGLYHIVVEDD